MPGPLVIYLLFSLVPEPRVKEIMDHTPMAQCLVSFLLSFILLTLQVLRGLPVLPHGRPVTVRMAARSSRRLDATCRSKSSWNALLGSVSSGTRPWICCPGKQAGLLAGRPRQHSGIEAAAGDRTDAYADGVRQGVPEAVRVADRWHLLRNPGDRIRTVFNRHPVSVQRASRQNEAQDDPQRLPAARSLYGEGYPVRRSPLPIMTILTAIGLEGATARLLRPPRNLVQLGNTTT